MVKSSAAEVGSIVPFEIRTIVFVIDTVAVVTTPCRIVIVNISGEFILVHNGGRSRCVTIAVLIVLILAYRSRCRGGILLIYYGRRRGRRAHINPDSRNTETSVDIYLGIGRAGDEVTCKDCSKDKQLFTHVHICLFRAFVILRVHFRRF